MMMVDFRLAAVADADVIAEVYLRSRKELVAGAPLAHSDESVRGYIRDRLIPAGMTTVATLLPRDCSNPFFVRE
jgi:hypothetical protein